MERVVYKGKVAVDKVKVVVEKMVRVKERVVKKKEMENLARERNIKGIMIKKLMI